MADAQVTKLPDFTIERGSDWKMPLPTSGTITIDGVAVDWEAAGSIQLQYRLADSTATPTRWKNTDGAARYDTATNSFLIPDDDAILGGSGDLVYHYTVHYFDASGNPKLVGRRGTITVTDSRTGLGE